MMKKTLSVLMLAALPVLALAGGGHQGGHDMAGHDYEINRQFAPYLGIEWKAKYVSGPGRLRGTFMKSSGFSLYHLFMASMGGTCPRAFWGMW